MRRRSFFTSAAAAAAGLMTWRPGQAAEPAPDPDKVDPYFLDPGLPGPEEKKEIEQFVDYQGKSTENLPALLPRGGKPKRAPNFRFLYWTGTLGSPEGRLVGPLTLQPAIETPPPYQLNAQIMGFNVSTEDWSGSSGKGTLTVEFRARNMGEALTWLFVQQFDVVKGAAPTVGLEYVAQREGKPDPVVCEDGNVDLRIQLMRHKTAPQLFRKILKLGATIAGLAVPGAGGAMSSMSSMSSMNMMGQAAPLLRVPRLAQEGVAFAQATVGGMADEAPIWRGGFNSYAIAAGAGRLVLRPGFWLAVDETADLDYTKLRLDDVGGRVGLIGPEGPVNLNYLVLAVEARASAGMRGEIRPKGA